MQVEAATATASVSRTPVASAAPGPLGVGALLLATAALLLVLLLAHRAWRAYCNYLRMRKAVADMPGSPTLPLVGNLLEIVAGGMDHVYDNFCRYAARYGPTTQVWVGPELVVGTVDPRDAEFIVTSQELLDKSRFYCLLEPLMGLGLICLGGQEARRHRKIVMPSLHLDILHDFRDAFQREATRFADRLERHADDGAVFDAAPLCVEFTMVAALKTIMTTEWSEARDANRLQKFETTIISAMDLFMYRVCRPWFLSDWLFCLSSRYHEYVRTAAAGNILTDAIIAEKRRQLGARKQAATSNTVPPRSSRRRAFLDNVMDSEEDAPLADLELREEVKTLLYTATETSATTLSFVLMALSMRQDVQDRLEQELKDVFGEETDTARPVTLEELPHLQYLERVIKETLRLFPSLPWFARSCHRDIQLPSGYTVPRGAHVLVFLPALHTNPEAWTEPRRFDPDRFLPERSGGRHPFSYLPFSAGPRNCIGQRYAMLLLKVQVATLLRRFRFLPPDDAPCRDVADVPIKLTLTIAARDGVRVRVQRRRHTEGKAM